MGVSVKENHLNFVSRRRYGSASRLPRQKLDETCMSGVNRDLGIYATLLRNSLLGPTSFASATLIYYSQRLISRAVTWLYTIRSQEVGLKEFEGWAMARVASRQQQGADIRWNDARLEDG
jgi:hypothetical protein